MTDYQAVKIKRYDYGPNYWLFAWCPGRVRTHTKQQ